LRGGSRSRIFALIPRVMMQRAKGPRRLACWKAGTWHHQGSRVAASFAEALRRRATDSMARAEQGKGVVQLSSLQTGGAGTRSMVWPFHVESWADRLHDSDQRAGKETSLLGALFATAW
jgi:hypothetical protein